MNDSKQVLHCETVRLDRWLFSARFFKTRQLAIDVINAGHVDVNGERAKAAKAVKVGDTVLVRKPPESFLLSVIALAEKRGSATVAKGLYFEAPASVEARAELAAQRRAMPPPLFKGRPTKRDRRVLQRFAAEQVPPDE